MYKTLMMIAAIAPQTGDNFPRGALFTIVGAAVLLAVGTAVFAKKKGNDSNDDEDDE